MFVCVPFRCHALLNLCLQAHRLEEENDCLQCQIAEEKLNSISSSVSSAAGKPDYSLDAVVGKLRKQKVEFCWECQLHVSQYDGTTKEGVLSLYASLFPSQVQFA